MTTLTAQSVTDQQGWMFDKPAVPHRPSVRTVRPNLPIIYYVGGTYTNVQGQEPGEFPFAHWMWPLLPPSVINATGGVFPGTSYLDLSRAEVINIPYPGSANQMNLSIADGENTTVGCIRKFPGKFALSGVSQGGSVCSQVYDRLRTDDLQDRRADFVGAAMWGNTRREQGRTYVEPTYGKYPDLGPTKSGMWLPNLVGTEDIWWEMINRDADDIVACCENNPAAPNWNRDKWVRWLFDITMGKVLRYLNFINPLEWWWAYLAYQEIQRDIFTVAPSGQPQSPHHRFWLEKPFEANGDSRAHSEVFLDYLNTFGGPQYVGQRHMFFDQRYEVGENRTVNVSGDTFWINLDVPKDTLALSVGLNAYDAQDNLVKRITPTRIPESTVSNPQRYQLDPITLATSFVTPPDTAGVRIVCDVEPVAMNSGIAWFANPTLATA